MTIEQLKKEEDFSAYLSALKHISQRYTVIITSYDTPYGPGYHKELSPLFANIGLSIDLYGRYRAGYVAVIDSGKVIFENISDGKPVLFEGVVNESNVKIISTGYNSNDWVSCLTINGKNCFAKSRGINIAVFDSYAGNLIDCVGFDTYTEGIPCTRPAETIEFIKRIQKEKNVRIVICRFPAFPSSYLTEQENKILSGEKVKNALLKYYSPFQIEHLISVPQSYYDVRGVRRFIDFNSELLNTSGGHRITCFQPKSKDRTIFMVGGCRMYGFGADDSHTIESQLQLLLNSEMPDKKIIVQNYGFMFTGMKKNEIHEIIEALPLKFGDIVLTEMNIGGYEDLDIDVIDLTDRFNCRRDFDAFFDTIHYTPDGNSFTANLIYSELNKKGLLNAQIKKTDLEIESAPIAADSEYLENYKRILKEYYAEKFPQPVIGAIVMNCNPFTFGHRYLIEKALEQCDFLIIFVVEEDKSFFSFEDRLNLVIKCTDDIANIEIIPSGKFIISSLTFSEYFNKSELQSKTIDTSKDVVLFAKEIAPCLHITKRFAGEEPNDAITRQYNVSMAKILPEYGIEFVEIPRMEINETPISASTVRELLENKQFDEIKKLVPEPSYNFLIERFS